MFAFFRWFSKHLLILVYNDFMFILAQDLFSVFILFILLRKSLEFLMCQSLIMCKRGDNILATDFAIYQEADSTPETRCGPMLVTEPNVVWLLVTVLVVAIVFVTTTLASGCFLCQILPCPRCVWKIYRGGVCDTIQVDLLLMVR